MSAQKQLDRCFTCLQISHKQLDLKRDRSSVAAVRAEIEVSVVRSIALSNLIFCSDVSSILDLYFILNAGAINLGLLPGSLKSVRLPSGVHIA